MRANVHLWSSMHLWGSVDLRRGMHLGRRGVELRRWSVELRRGVVHLRGGSMRFRRWSGVQLSRRVAAEGRSAARGPWPLLQTRRGDAGMLDPRTGWPA